MKTDMIQDMQMYMDEINVPNLINQLFKDYGYKKLSPDLSEYYRDLYLKDIPKFLNINGGGPLFTLNGSLICQSYDRVVIGDYGAYVEFTTPGCQFVVEKGQEYRYQDKYKNCKYFWLTVPDESHIKIYKQRHTVSYADYLVGKFYVSVYEVQPERG